VQISCTVAPGPAGKPPLAFLVVRVKERPVLGTLRVTGTKWITEKAVRARINLTPGRPIPPDEVARAVTRIDSLYAGAGYFIASVTPESTTVAGRTDLTFRIDEGGRLAVSGIRIHGNFHVSAKAIVGAMKTRPEGFLWFRKGAFDRDEFANDLGQRLPDFYSHLGFIDFQVVRDTLIIDRRLGKALIDLTVNEGKQYHVGTFDVLGNHHFTTEEVQAYFPFTNQPPTFATRATRFLFRRNVVPIGIFDRARWDDATDKLRTAYSNEGYIYATVEPIIDRGVNRDSVPVVNLRWEIVEKTPAIVHRIEIVGNDYTSEDCIRNQLSIVPGYVFSQDLLMRSYQALGNLGFFDTPIPPPDTRPAGDSGDIDLIFHVKEKHTGNVNFGASTGQGTGVGGFIGFDQPNLFGECKKGSIQWQFGKYINNLTLSYTDPTIRGTRISGTLAVYRTESEYTIGNLGQSTTLGSNIQFGFPVPHSYFSRLFVSYGLENVHYNGDTTSLLGSLAPQCHGCVRSAIGVSFQHDTRVDMPFASSGGLQVVSTDFDGGPLGGSAHYQRLITEIRGYTTLATFGATGIGSSPIKLVAGVKVRDGFLFGTSGPFFVSQAFALGGTQYGEQLRGYKEFSISPAGYITGTSTYNATQASFGNAFITTTSELGIRFNSSIYFDTFLDAGNLYATPAQFDPTRLYRGVGVGIAVVTPLGPLGLDYAYGIDKLNAAGQPDPGWELHFKLGQVF
jgi:outer membrane protein insertion porin family